MYGMCVSCLPSSVGLCRLCLRRMCLHGAYTLIEPLVITCVYALIAWAAIDCQCTIVEPLCQAGQHRTLPRRSARLSALVEYLKSLVAGGICYRLSLVDLSIC